MIGRDNIKYKEEGVMSAQPNEYWVIDNGGYVSGPFEEIFEAEAAPPKIYEEDNHV